MGKFSFAPALFLLCTFGFPIFYLVTRYFLNRFSKFRCGPPVLEFLGLAMMVLPITIVIHDALSRPVAQVIYNHWRSGSLNQTTIAKIESEFKSKSDAKRTAAAASEKATE
ncbi:MAG: hypothetical protein H7Z71_00790 [Moraxellaceae bacterium]|nr:hypothetical protein [Pseudobdellovibrionaceae bacterium]